MVENKNNSPKNKIELKGGNKKMKAKASIAMALIMVLGIFALAVSASATTNTTGSDNAESAVAASAVVSGTISQEDVEQTVNEVENEIKPYLPDNRAPNKIRFRRIGFTKVWTGQGWITNNDQGYLINGMWVSQQIAVINPNSNISATESLSSMRYLGYGRLKISGVGVYKLKKINNESSGENEVSFYVIPTARVRIPTVEVDENESPEDSSETETPNSQIAPIGKLVLRKTNSYPELTLWKGTLTFESGELTGTWDVELGTRFNRLKPHPILRKKVKEVKNRFLNESGVSSVGELSKEQKQELKKEIREEVKRPLWRRIFFFWRR